ncbi:hypothetical protein DY000_02005272 [Brassica cretica]|uniref:Uncharacterized protein n=1 Tax=Brassica cretica TaxID=69181 RepID=A0ABQ7BZC2_BRACR|nr:hypothetical protein DY000_02005272 [Brassica cretica]
MASSIQKNSEELLVPTSFFVAIPDGSSDIDNLPLALLSYVGARSQSANEAGTAWT